MDVGDIKKHAATLMMFFIFSFLFLAVIQFNTTLHESYHAILLKLVGCETKSVAQIFTGKTGFNCMLTPTQKITIALAAPVISYIVGLFLWNWQRDGIIGLFGLMAMFYSAMPSLFPLLQGSDMYFALMSGFPLWAGWTLFLLASGILYYVFATEVLEKDILKIRK